MSGGKPKNNEDEFNNPFSALKKQVNGGKKGDLTQPQAKRAAGAGPQSFRPTGPANPSGKPPGQSKEEEDAAASAMFLAAMGRNVSKRGTEGEAGEQSMAELFAEAQKKARPETLEPASGNERTDKIYLAAKAAQRKVERNLDDIPPVELSQEESMSFAEAMQGVKPVDASRGRALAPPAPPAPIRHQSAERDYLTEFTEGKFEFALEYTEEFFEGHVMGMDPLVIAKLRAGQYSPETHLDLHGMNAEQAYGSLLDFIKNAYNQGKRNIVVVTGRGKNSPGGLSVLRQYMQDWLTKEPLRRVVLAFCTAQPKDGGAGALYVILRKYKKSQGKIRWERGPWEEKPLL